ncbi:MAG: hypothetical protein PHT41_06235 [Candidatus Omnitrophica bacterium]|nr:hypothetical protein [Candidatus Omnitrophota bacterium]MDD5238689.1 hypothetical protein [Candidatus Omnitrophota bacterium]
MPLKKKRPKKRLTKKRAIKRKAQKKRPLKKKPLRKKIIAVRKKVGKKEKEKVIGIVTHYFPKVRAAVVKLKAPLLAGDRIRVKGHTTDFTQTATSLQIDRVPINSAQKGQEIGLLVDSRVRQHDKVYKA